MYLDSVRCHVAKLSSSSMTVSQSQCRSLVALQCFSIIITDFLFRSFFRAKATPTRRSWRGWRRSCLPTSARWRTSLPLKANNYQRWECSGALSYLLPDPLPCHYRTYLMTSQSTGSTVPRTEPSLWTRWTAARSPPAPAGSSSTARLRGGNTGRARGGPGYPPQPSTGAMCRGGEE